MSISLSIHKKAVFSGHKDCIYALEKSGTPDNFFSAGGDGMIVQWNINQPENGELIVKVPNSVYALKYLEEKNQLLAGQNFEGLHLIDLTLKKEIRSLKTTSSYIFDIQVFEHLAFIACGDGEIAIVNLNEFRKIHSIKPSEKSARTIAINPIVKEFAVGFSDNSVRIYSLKDYSLQNEIEAHSISVFTVRYSPDYKYLFTGSRDAHLKIWDCWNHYELCQTIVAHMYALNHIDFSPDGRYFATASMDKSIKLWDMETFCLLKVIDKSRHAGHATSVNRLLWTTYPMLLLSGSDDKKISMWEIKKEYTENTNQTVI